MPAPRSLRTHLKPILSLGILSALVLISSCSQNQTSGPAPQEKKIMVAGILFQDDQFFKLVSYGMQDAAKKNNAAILIGNSANALDKEISLVDTYIANKANAIVVSPLNSKGSVSALKRAHDAGIKIITYNTSIEGDIPECNVESDQTDLGASTGKAAVDYINKKFKGKAKIAMIEFMSLSPEQSGARVKGFHDEITKLPGVQIISEQDAWLAPNAADIVENILTAHPDINIIWAANEGGTVGAVRAVKNAGKAGKVVVFGTDMSDQLADFLNAKDNILQAVTGQKPFDIGVASVENAIKAINGEKVEKKISLSGVLFSREKIQEVNAYQKRLKELSK